jgi:DNA polymerase III subunit delta
VTPDDLSKLLNQIDKGRIEPFYFLHGPERYYQTEVIQALIRKWITEENRDFNLDTFDFLSIPENQSESSLIGSLMGSLRTISFLGGIRLVIVRNLHEAFARNKTLSDQDAQILIDYAKAPLEETCLVVTADKADGKRKLFKALKKIKGSVSCEAPIEKERFKLISWVVRLAKEQGYSMPEDVAQSFVSKVGTRPGILVKELEKTLLYAGKNKSISIQDVTEVVGETAAAEDFGLTNALQEKKFEKAMDLLRKHLEHGDAPELILGSISSQFRIIWKVQSYLAKGLSQNQIAKEIGAHPYRVQMAAKCARKFSTQQLRNCYSELVKADRGIKSTANREGIMETLIVNLFRLI